MSERSSEGKVHRYFDDDQDSAKQSKPLLSRRSIAVLSSCFAIVSAALALWLLQYDLVGSTIGLGFVLVGSVACIVSRRADGKVRLLPALGVAFLVLSGTLLLASFMINWMFGSR